MESNGNLSRYVMTENIVGNWNLFIPTSDGIKAICNISYGECVNALYEEGILNIEEYNKCKRGIQNMIGIGGESDYNADPKKNVIEILNKLEERCA